MNTQEKERFVRELVASTQQKVLEQIAKMPEDWDGIELRQYLADCFAGNVSNTTWNKSRMKSYRNEVIVRNL